jgi:hypothetical protein
MRGTPDQLAALM